MRILHLNLNLAFQISEKIPQLRNALVLNPVNFLLLARGSSLDQNSVLINLSHTILGLVDLDLQILHILVQLIEIILIGLSATLLQKYLIQRSFKLSNNNLLLLNYVIELALFLLLALQFQELLLLCELGCVLCLQLFLQFGQILQLESYFPELVFERAIGLQQRQVRLRAAQEVRSEFVQLQGCYFIRNAHVRLVYDILLHLQSLT